MIVYRRSYIYIVCVDTNDSIIRRAFSCSYTRIPSTSL